MSKLSVQNLTISFRTNSGALRAVRDVSFDLEAGETFAIVGESGSGKSVTSRAIMGILAGNAMVDGGRILYDGRDLLRIPEEEFHTLRGHRLAMVFQDPLSALNPIMRVGNQLTEAMLLNNKERRADAAKQIDRILKTVKDALTEAGAFDDEAKKKLAALEQDLSAGMRAEYADREKRERVTELLDCLDELSETIAKEDTDYAHGAEKRMRGIIKKLTADEAKACGLSLSNLKALCGAVLSRTGKAHSTADGMKHLNDAMDALRRPLMTFSESEIPDYYNSGRMRSEYAQLLGKASVITAERAKKTSKRAAEILKDEQKIFKAEPLSRTDCKRAVKHCSEAVNGAIDPLRIQKDNEIYVFGSSLATAVDRCFLAKIRNPREEKRFAREKRRYDRLKARGRFAPTPVPKDVIDEKTAAQHLAEIPSAMLDRLNNMTYEPENGTALVDMLLKYASEKAFRLGKGVARHRAIELLREVGIPEPYKRYTKYPFECSGGMRQRFVIAIALSADPDILICDEPTTALDVTIQAQILELINRLKEKRNLSIIFITHDLGVVANMADRIAVMYAGKIVEYGTADEIFYDPRHPYTWALLSSMPDPDTKERLESIPGTPPDMLIPPKGDAFAARNRYAMQIDFEEQPPMFKITDTHSAATWLLHPDAPQLKPPKIVTDRIERMRVYRKETGNENS